jgi:putative Holliday junction resolvase
MPIIKNVKEIYKDKYHNKRALSVDFGTRVVGLAISDATGLIANSYSNLVWQSQVENIVEIEKIIKKENIFFLVIGLPKSLDSSSNITYQKVKSFANLLNQKLGIDIFFWDERFSSKSAEKLVAKKKEFRKIHDDQIAACIILQNFLDFKNYSKQ